MSDNVTFQSATQATPPDTTVVATDQDPGTGAHAQLFKLAVSANGDLTLIPADAANGLDVDVTRVSGVVHVDDNSGSLTVDPNTGTVWDVSDRDARLAGRVKNLDSTGTVIDPATKGQLPAALVAGRLDENVGAWLGSTAPTVGQKAMASSVPVALASDQSTIPVSMATQTPDVTDRSARLLGHVTVDSSALPTGAATDSNLTAILGSPSETPVTWTVLDQLNRIRKDVALERSAAQQLVALQTPKPAPRGYTTLLHRS